MVAVLSNRGRHLAVTMQRNTAQGEGKEVPPAHTERQQTVFRAVQRRIRCRPDPFQVVSAER